ncbi:hypothetical protein [Siphonobacter sp. SORGH_AS_0500]|uniref:hypothetical protein n=1 Tax=Siphonobacter sp. SORGH_AS_0500 TaxID=1864824 RepID=UPI00285BD7F3|nr:hypothetical protein [Siphonobacter sp. SORGH_AS_0500]MDR6197745.1 hypothetical protein [Siphonobacter sp. SORGH_AS_0500]
MKKIVNQFGAKELIKKDNGSLVQQELIKNQITVIPELETLIPPLLDDEYRQLEANIIKEGCREPLLVWETPAHTVRNTDDETSLFVLIDGHNRYSICTTHGIPYRILMKEFSSIEDVRTFMIDNQLGRRNLTPEQTSYLRGQKYLSMKRGSGRPTGNAAGKRTEEVLAEQFNVSPKTIRTDAEFAKGLDKTSPALKKEILSRKSKVSKKSIVGLASASEEYPAFDSVEQINQALTKTKKAAKPVLAEVAKLKQLVESLERAGGNNRELCEEIIEVAEALLQNSD